MSTVANLQVRFGADWTGVKNAVDGISKSLQPMADKLQSVGKTMSLYVTAPLAAMGAASLAAFDKQDRALAKVESSLRSTGGVAGWTLDQLTDMATGMQRVTRFGDEQILDGVIAQLLTFTNIGGEAFEQTAWAALDLATTLDGDLKSATIMLGKALNDPVSNLGALGRAGIQFSDEQEALIKSLAAAGDMAGAQAIILAELDTQFGDTARAVAQSGIGPLIQFKNAMGDVTERIGETIWKGMKPFVEVAKDVAYWLHELPQPAITTAVVIGGIVAAIGPLLFGLGSLIKLLPVLKAGWLALTGPIGLTVVAITALATSAFLVYRHWEGLTQWFGKLWDGVKNVFGLSIDILLEEIKMMWPKAQAFFLEGIASLLSPLERFARWIGAGGFADKIAGFGDGLREMVPNDAIAASEARLGALRGELMSSLAYAAQSAWFAAKGVGTSIVDGISTGLEGGGSDPANPFGGGGGVGGAMAKALPDVEPQRLVPLGQETLGTGVLLAPVVQDLQVGGEMVSHELNELELKMADKWERFLDLTHRMGDALRDAMTTAVVGLAEGFGKMAVGVGNANNLGSALLGTFASLMQQLGAMLISFGTAGLAFQKSGGFLSFLTNPIAAIGAGMLLVAAGAAIKGLLNRSNSAAGGMGGGGGVSSIGVNANGATRIGGRGLEGDDDRGGSQGGQGQAQPSPIRLVAATLPSGDIVFSGDEGERRFSRSGSSLT